MALSDSRSERGPSATGQGGKRRGSRQLKCGGLNGQRPDGQRPDGQRLDGQRLNGQRLDGQRLRPPSSARSARGGPDRRRRFEPRQRVDHLGPRYRAPGRVVLADDPQRRIGLQNTHDAPVQCRITPSAHPTYGPPEHRCPFSHGSVKWSCGSGPARLQGAPAALSGVRRRPGEPVEGFPVLARGLLDDRAGQRGRGRGLVPVEGFEVVAHELLVEARRA